MNRCPQCSKSLGTSLTSCNSCGWLLWYDDFVQAGKDEIDRMRREARPYSEFKREAMSKLNKPK